VSEQRQTPAHRKFSVGDAWSVGRLSLRTSWQASKLNTSALILTPLIVSLAPAALAIALRGLINGVVDELAGAVSSGRGWEFFVLVSLGLALMLAAAQSVDVFFVERHIELLDQQVGIGVLEHAQTLEFGYFEDPKFHDTIQQVREAPGAHVQEVLAKCIRSASAFITIASLLIVLASIEVRLILYVLPLSVPFLVQRWWIGRLRYETQVAQQRSRRWVEYFSGQMMSANSVPEARVLGIGPLFIGRAERRLACIRSENESVYRKQALSSALFNSLAVCAVYLALFQATRRTIDGDLTVGDIAVFAAAATAVRGSIELLFSNLSALRWHMAHMIHLREFLALPPTRGGRPPSRHRVTSSAVTGDVLVRVENVSFTYPGASAPTLRDLNLEIREGETLGLVGRNGSGKSTLVKLLTGLYMPNHGSIDVNGLRTDVADLKDLRQHMSVVFQNFNQYNATVGENIALGDLDRLLDQPARIRQVAEWAGLDELIESLPDGYDTLLGREFGDVSLSGGQWQRLAIARAFAHDAPLMILDEPTASLDAEAEFAVFERFRELAAGKAALLISHRFSTLLLADRIAVIDEGRIVESGTHDDLLKAGGAYADLHRLFRTSSEPGVGAASPDA